MNHAVNINKSVLLIFENKSSLGILIHKNDYIIKK